VRLGIESLSGRLRGPCSLPHVPTFNHWKFGPGTHSADRAVRAMTTGPRGARGERRPALSAAYRRGRLSSSSRVSNAAGNPTNRRGLIGVGGYSMHMQPRCSDVLARQIKHQATRLRNLKRKIASARSCLWKVAAGMAPSLAAAAQIQARLSRQGKASRFFVPDVCALLARTCAYQHGYIVCAASTRRCPNVYRGPSMAGDGGYGRASRREMR
jgi:hypothetical protein